MAGLRPTRGKEVLRKLQRAGFVIIRTKGSADYLRHPQTGRLTSVHLHGKRDIPPTLLPKIVVHQAGLTIEQCNAL